MKFRYLALTAAMFLPMSACRTTDSSLQTLPNAARTQKTALEQNVCHKDMKSLSADEQKLRADNYAAWLKGDNPAIRIGNTNKTLLTEELKQTLNAVPMNVLMAYFLNGGKIVVNEAAEAVCAGEVANYTPEKRMYALEDSAPLSAKSADVKGKMTSPARPQELPKLVSCYVSIKGKSGVEIHIDDAVVTSDKSVRSDKKLASAVRHGTLRMFSFVFSELIAHTYIAKSKQKDPTSEADAKSTFEATSQDTRLADTDKAEFTQTTDIKFNSSSKKIEIPVNKEFMSAMKGMFNTLAQDVRSSSGKYDLYHYRGFVDSDGFAQKKYENVLNHFAFAEAFDSYYCNNATQKEFAADFRDTWTTFDDIRGALESIELRTEDGTTRTGSISDNAGYLLASSGGWHADIYHGVFGENLNLDTGIQTQTGPKISLFFGFFAAVGWGIARSLYWVTAGAFLATRFAVRGVARLAWGAVATVGATVGTVSSAFFPRLTAWRAAHTHWNGPFARGYVAAARFWNGGYWG